MPTYGYECTACKEQFEVFQRMTDAPLAIHDDCGGELRRLLYPVGIVFKGPGFHVNDYGRKNGGSAKAEAKTDSGSDKTEKSESKPEAKSDLPAAKSE